MDPKLVSAARSAFGTSGPAVTLGAPVHEGACHPEPLVRLPLAMLTRHGLIAGATGTGKTKTLQVLAEQCSAAGVPVFLADVKGDVAGIAVPGEASDRVRQRAAETGWNWQAAGCPVEVLSITGALGAPLRATVSSFGPTLLARVLGLNETQTSVLALVFKWADDRDLELFDLADLRAVLEHLTGAGAADLRGYGGISRASANVLLRTLAGLEQEGGAAVFGEPELDLDDLLRTTADGRGVVTLLALRDVQDRPRLFSTMMLWMLARLHLTLPEVGDVEQPKLVFVMDEAHLLFDGATRGFRDQVEQVVRLIRSKGVALVFVTQSPRDLPGDVLGQLGNRIQHALRAFTPEDEAALRAAARTFPKTPFYDVPATLQSLGTGEALVTVLSPQGTPTPPVATRLVPPASRMGPLTDAEQATQRARSELARRYGTAVNRESAAEKLAGAAAPAEADAAPAAPPPTAPPAGPSTLERILRSPVARSVAVTVAGAITRGVLGAVLGPTRRRRR